MGTLREECLRIIQEFLQSRPEDAAWMRGPWCAERQRVYEQAMSYVLRKIPPVDDWHERLKQRDAVIREVQQILIPDCETEIG